MRARQLARFSLGQRSNPCGPNVGGCLDARTQPRVSNWFSERQRKRHFTRPNWQTVIGFLVNGWPGPNFGGRFAKRDAQNEGLFKLNFVWLADVRPATWYNVLRESAKRLHLLG